jgi:metal-dependent amidase/aminoacylase/carboxypeptidase family protein
MMKKATFRGKSAHAGGSPHKGINALYAATTAISVANAIRETFREKDTIRFHPIITKGGTVVNAIPDEVTTEAYIRGANYQAIAAASEKINRAFAGAAAAMGCGIEFEDEFKSAPRINDANFRRIFGEVAALVFPKETVDMEAGWVTGCSDMGDISCVMPTIHPYICGAEGIEHGNDYIIADPEKTCVAGAKILAGVTRKLLCEEAAAAKKILAEAQVPFANKEAFLRAKEAMSFCGEGVVYNEDGTVTLKYQD